MSERDDLHGLLTHPGWLKLKAEAETYWRDQHDEHVAHAANERDDVSALNKLRQVIAAKNAVMAVLQWPEDRLRALDGTNERAVLQATPQLQRGGYATRR